MNFILAPFSHAEVVILSPFHVSLVLAASCLEQRWSKNTDAKLPGNSSGQQWSHLIMPFYPLLSPLSPALLGVLPSGKDRPYPSGRFRQRHFIRDIGDKTVL